MPPDPNLVHVLRRLAESVAWQDRREIPQAMLAAAGEIERAERMRAAVEVVHRVCGGNWRSGVVGPGSTCLRDLFEVAGLPAENAEDH